MNEEGVSEMIGTVLLLGITVAIAGLFGFILLSQDGPSEYQYSQVRYGLQAGPDNTWDTGDEMFSLSHRGGEPFLASQTTIRLTLNGTLVEVTGAALGGHFADGQLSIGETWTYTLQAAADEPLEVRTIVPQQLHSEWKNGVSSGGGGVVVNPCDSDTTNPTVGAITTAPADINTDTVGSVLVTVPVTDACGLQSVTLTYGTSGSTTVTMTQSGTWQATIPDLGWSTLGGSTLSLQVLATDTSGNQASASRNEAIDQIGVNFPYWDTNCNGQYDAGESNLASALSDGKHKDQDACVVLPAGWGAQTRNEWDLDVGSLLVRTDLYADDKDIDLQTRVGNLDIQGMRIEAVEKVQLRAELLLAANNATIMGREIDIDEEGNAGTMDFRDATLIANGGSGDHINIRNDGDWIRMERATMTGNGDIIIRADTTLAAASSTLSAGDDITLTSTGGMDVRNADHTAVDNMAIVTQVTDSVQVENFCGHDEDDNIPATGIISGIIRIGCAVVV
ncbi:MAG: type IV pilin [Thermoplasmatota archaeon]